MRALVFDATTGPYFQQQWQRYDWRLLRNGHVYRYDDAEALDAAADELASLRYLVHRVDADGWRAAEDLHAGLAGALNFPDYYGHNLDALADAFGDVAQYDYGSDQNATGTVLVIGNYRRVLDVGPELANTTLDLFARAARLGLLLGHPMLCLVECAAELGPIGAVDVMRELPPVPGRSAQ